MEIGPGVSYSISNSVAFSLMKTSVNSPVSTISTALPVIKPNIFLKKSANRGFSVISADNFPEITLEVISILSSGTFCFSFFISSPEFSVSIFSLSDISAISSARVSLYSSNISF